MIALAVVSVACIAVLGLALRVVLAENRRLVAALAADRGAAPVVARVLADVPKRQPPADEEPRKPPLIGA